MEITIVGTGFIGTTLGRSLVASGHSVTFGSRHPDSDEARAIAPVRPLPDALAGADVVILALPGAAVTTLAETCGSELDGALVIDATNTMGAEVANARDSLPTSVRYARAFNTLGGENMADPIVGGERADMFFSAPEADHDVVAAVVEGVGLRPIYVGEDKEGIIDALFLLWISLALGQGRGRRLALRLLEG